MPVFHLFPKLDSSGDPDWEATTLRDACWVLADTEADARQKVSYATGIATEKKPGELVRTSPWKNPKLTDCVLDSQSPGQVIYGVILTEEGRTIKIK